MAKRKRRYFGRKKRAGGGKKPIHIGAVVGAAMGFALPFVSGNFDSPWPAGQVGAEQGWVKGGKQYARLLLDNMTGVDVEGGTWHPQNLIYFWGPVAGGAIAGKIASMLGVNRMMPKGIKV